MKKIMCLLVFLAVASMAMAAIEPVKSVVVTDAPGTPYAQKLLQSITVGTDTFSTLKTGTTTQNNVLVPKMDDFDLNTAFTGYTNVSKTVSFNGTNYISINGSKPDFFLFEATSTTGNPESGSIAAIFPDDTLGAWVALPTAIGTTGAVWGNTGLTVVGAVNNGQRITGISFDITDLKDAAGTKLSSNAVIKGIAIGPTGIGLDPIMLIASFRTPVRGEAHTPVPTDRNSQVDIGVAKSLSWYSPEQDKNGVPVDDPNIVSITGYDVRFGTNPDPNSLTPVFTTLQNFSVSLDPATTNYWCVDTHVTWNKGSPSVVKGPVWQFTTLAPALAFKNVITTLDLLPAALSATVTGFKNPISSVGFELLTAGATLTDTTTNNQNPTATLTTTTAGAYQVKLTVSDGTTTLDKTSEVKVYADACAAKKAAPSGWTANYYDQDGNCLVNISDFAVLAQNWLNNTEMKAQESYVKDVVVLELDIQVECENAYAPTDPDYTTQAPLEVNNGAPSIGFDSGAAGGQLINGFGSANLLTYQVVVPQTGAYTLHFRAFHEWIRQASFDLVTSVSPDGNPANDVLANIAVITMNQTAGAKWYSYSATVNLTAGTHLIRMTNSGAAIGQPWGFSPDFFGFKKN